MFVNSYIYLSLSIIIINIKKRLIDESIDNFRTRWYDRF